MKSAHVQEMNDAQTLEAALIAYWLKDGGPANASKQELIDRGYLKDTWLVREKVDTTPIELPVAEAPAEAI